MIRYPFILIVSLFTFTVLTNINAKNPDNRDSLRSEKKGNWLTRFIKSFDEYDTRYITPNYYNYTSMLQSSTIYEIYKLSGTDSKGGKQSITFTSNPSFKIGPYLGWRWLFLGYQFDISDPTSSRKKTEFDLSLYSSMIGCDLIYQKNRGDFKFSNLKGFEQVEKPSIKGKNFGGMKTDIISANIYYIFNHKHFSYPAAYSQSTVQRKSCGSWKLGATFTRHKIDFDYNQLSEKITGTDKSSLLSDAFKFNQITYYDYSFNIGYAYNWVFAKNCLFNISLAPAIGYKYSTVDGNPSSSTPFNFKDFTLDFITRVGLVWNNTKWYGGASLVLHTYDYKKDKLSITNSLGYLKIYFGMNFMRKRQYRKKLLYSSVMNK